jgi:hypothetical protein
MTTIQFYKKVSKLITDTRDQFLTLEEAEEKLDSLMELAKIHNIGVHFDKSILQWENLYKFDDEQLDEPTDTELEY